MSQGPPTWGSSGAGINRPNESKEEPQLPSRLQLSADIGESTAPVPGDEDNDMVDPLDGYAIS